MPDSRVTARRKAKDPKKSKAGQASAARRKGIKEEAEINSIDGKSSDDELNPDMEPSFGRIDLTASATHPGIAEDQAATATPTAVAPTAVLSREDLILTATANQPKTAAGQEVEATLNKEDEDSAELLYLSDDEIRRKDVNAKGPAAEEPTAKEPTVSREGSAMKSLKRGSTAGSSTPHPPKRVKTLRAQQSVVMPSIEVKDISDSVNYVAPGGRTFSVKSSIRPDAAKDALWAAIVNRVPDFVKRIVDSAWNSEFTNEEIAAVDLTAAASLLPTLVNNQGDIRTRAQTGTLTQMKGGAVKTFLKKIAEAATVQSKVLVKTNKKPADTYPRGTVFFLLPP